MIDIEEILLRENASVEWKENVADISDVLKTITAFANDFQNVGGGYVVCGAKEIKDAYGFQSVQRTGLDSSRYKEIQGKVQDGCVKNIFPSITPLVQELPAETPEKKILVFIVPASKSVHSFRIKGHDSGICYIRLNNETKEARNELFRDLLVKKNNMEAWDRRLNEKATLADINIRLLQLTLERMDIKPQTSISRDNAYFTNPLSAFVPSLAEKRSLDKEICPRNFATALFGNEPTFFFQGAWTRVSFYPGEDKSGQYSELHNITGGLIEQTEKILSLLKMQQAVLVDKNSQTPNITKYPERALKEAVVNAIVHRDYESDQPTRVTAFSDRVEIRSPGALLRQIDKDQFLRGAAPVVWRNQTLAWFFNKLQLSQSEGQGIPTIFRTMREHGSPDPKFFFDEDAVTCVLYAHPRRQANDHFDSEALVLNSKFISILSERINEFHKTRLLPKESREKALNVLFSIEEFLKDTPLFTKQSSTRVVIGEIEKIKKGESELSVLVRENLVEKLIKLSKEAMLKNL
ncbi:MAG: putative DNA binding domain-containing protein [Puniceicoccales bacterium]|jgi:ATP-dependent DNA helicase RecG|nr:putative DNA binding domain-containing protein [Puniceicoccales bacterium]